MSKKMLINASHPEENRVGIVVDGILSELDIELAGQEQSKGNIYKAVVVRVETGLQAAFVDYGAEKLGFLQIGEIHPQIYPPKEDTKGRPRINDILHRGQEILVQIVKEERGSKGAALTTYLSIPGRYMVLMPDSVTKGVSRKISDEAERKKLKKTMASLDLPEKMGYIVRTAGIGKDKDELKRDFDYLVRLYEGIIARRDQVKAPSQLYQESNLAIRSIRDYFSADMDEVLIDDENIYQDARDFFALVMPELQHLVKRHRERRPIFSRYQIEEQIDGLSRNQIPLPSGGSIVIDQTEALVAIDVNSGKMASESGIEATALKTNMEAAAEVGRQLRLRDLGGLIVIDFIDMRDRKNIREVELQLRKALKDDKAKVSVGRISQFGLMEMSRQRLKPVLSVGAYRECPHCKGIGRIKSIEAQAVAFLRQAHTGASKGQINHIEARVPTEVANYLLNQKRKTIHELEHQLNLEISILGTPGLLPGEIDLQLHKREKETDNSRQIVPVSHANQIEIALAAAQLEELQTTETVTEQGTEPESADAVEDAPQEPVKKKRRRRRKKPSAATESSQSEPVAVQQTEDKPADQESVSANPAEGGDVAAEPEDPSTKTKKPRRRSRKSSKKTEGQTTGTEKVEQASSQADNPAGGEQPTTEIVEAEMSPKPRRRPRRTSKKTQAAETGAPAEASDSAPSEPSKSETEEPNAAPTEPKTDRKPRRRTRKPAADSTPAPAPTGEGGGQSGSVNTGEPAMDTATQPEPQLETVEKPKRRRTPRKKTAEPESGVGSTAQKDGTASPSPSQQTAEQPEPTAADKPKPTRRPRRTQSKGSAVNKPAEEPQQDELPPKKPRRRTAAKKPAPEAVPEQ